MKKPKGNLFPTKGGCWICWTDDPGLVFDSEWDTFVHPNCIREVLKEEPDHPEVRCMAYLVEE